MFWPCCRNKLVKLYIACDYVGEKGTFPSKQKNIAENLRRCLLREDGSATPSSYNRLLNAIGDGWAHSYQEKDAQDQYFIIYVIKIPKSIVKNADKLDTKLNAYQQHLNLPRDLEDHTRAILYAKNKDGALMSGYSKKDLKKISLTSKQKEFNSNNEKKSLLK